MKKIILFITLVIVAFSVTACADTLVITYPTTTLEAIEINVDRNIIDITKGDDYQLVVTSNDPVGLIYSVDKAGIITLSDTGYITSLKEGTVTVKITSRSNPEVYQEITVNVLKEIYLVSDRMTINLKEGETRQLSITSNDGYTFSVTNPEILTVNETGLITAKKEGTTTITVTSTYDLGMSITITVNVAKLINIDVLKSDYVLVEGDTDTIDVTSNDGLTYLSGDTGIVTVDSDGNLTAVGFGETFVRITSTYDDEVSVEVSVKVYKYTEDITITGSDLLIKGMETKLSIEVSPVGGFQGVIWESSDESILTVDELGNVTAVSAGSATIIAKSTLDDTIADAFNIDVINVLLVDGSKGAGDTYIYEGLEMEYGVQLFSSINDALNKADENTLIYLEDGTYQENFSIENDGITLEGLNDLAVIDGSVDVLADNVTLKNIIFEGNAKIINTALISDFTFIDNTVRNITTEDPSFINLLSATNTVINNNSFTSLQSDAITLIDFLGELTEINHNIIDSCSTAIKIKAMSELTQADEVRIFWNTITNVDLAFDIDMLVDSVEQDIYKVARFNSVTNYANAVNVNSDSQFDFTLNYWGTTSLDDNKFTNVDPYYLKGYYSDSESMPTEETYNPELPVIITITNPIDEITIGETYQFEYEILPYELSDAPIRFITGNPDIIAINQDGVITPLSSGEVYIQIRSARVSSIKTQLDFSVITTPGIEITTSNIYSDVQVGDSFTLGTILFPYTIEGETASIVSSAPEVADINEEGVVNTYGEGLVTFTAYLDSDPTVSVDYIIYVHGALDPDNNLLDYLTERQISYSTIHEWTAYGFQFNYYDKRPESVSRYYFDNIEVNQSKMLPVSYGIRPGEPMDPLVEGPTAYNPDINVTKYNAENVYWIVVHDTASTATGSNALAHANYLYNAAMAGTELWVSWHFTVDDHDIYQHLPEYERGYHAGDGSSTPHTGYVKNSVQYLGGGNRNGVGIEMSVNQDGDMYRTWQRTAKLVAYLLDKYNLPLDHQKYHHDFSGKDCPNTLRNAGLVPLFEQFVASEYYIKTNYPNAVITMTSNNPEYLDNHGRIIKLPQRALTVSYTITVTNNGTTESRTFYTYIPGTVR